MPIPTVINSEEDAFPQDVEFSLRALHKQFGASITMPTAFNVLRDAAKLAMKHDTPCKVKEFPRLVMNWVYELESSPRYLARHSAYAEAVAEIRRRAKI